MFQMLQNLPHITKNILIINVLLFVATFLFQGQIDLIRELGAYTFNSPLFQPYQIVTHFFMHGGLMHIFFNMFALVMFGAHLERIWGPKRFFVFYIISALGAYLLYGGIGTYEMYQAKMEILNTFNNGELILSEVNNAIIEGRSSILTDNPDTIAFLNSPLSRAYINPGITPMVGASGAIFGLLAAFGTLFPNTQLMLLFPPIPIKAKYLVIGLMVISIYLGLNQFEGDNIAHFAHVGGGLVGFIMVKIWQRNRTTFY